MYPARPIEMANKFVSLVLYQVNIVLSDSFAFSPVIYIKSCDRGHERKKSEPISRR
jgi:hypothetical protein